MSTGVANYVCPNLPAAAAVYKAGGKVLADEATLVRCTEAARLRYRELTGLLEQSLGRGAEAAS